MSSVRPTNIGVKAIEIYFPSQVSENVLSIYLNLNYLLIPFPIQCVDQAELEKFDGVAQGKYTIGLGQTRMSFCDDREGENDP